jgi:hypothetical protein
MITSSCHLSVSDEDLIETIVRMLNTKANYEAATLLRRCRALFEETGYDNWNGGTYTFTLYVQVSPETFVLLEKRIQLLQEQISQALSAAVKQMSSDWFTVEIAPLVVGLPGRPDLQGCPVTKRVRRAVVSILQQEGVDWNGSLDPVEFLSPLFQLDKLPSTDSRFKDAAGDIWQHCVNNPEDWPADWVFTDGRLNLLNGPDATFLAFVERSVHPSVRPPRLAKQLVQKMNQELQRDGWHLEELQLASDDVGYRVSPWNPAYGRAEESLHRAALILSSSWMYQEIQRIESSIDSDPALAIGTAKELIDTCCKHIADRMSITLPANPDTPDLVKAVLKELKLVPEGISDQAKGAEVIKKTLRTLSTTTQGLAEIRNLYGTGHGKNSRHKGLQPRHARLAVATAAAFAEFIVETYKDRLQSEQQTRQ